MTEKLHEIVCGSAIDAACVVFTHKMIKVRKFNRFEIFILIISLIILQKM